MKTRVVALSLLAAAMTACAGPRAVANEPPPEVVQRGATLYRAHGCTVCHGASGHGDGPNAQRFDPRPRDFRDLASYRQGTGTQEIAETLRTGVPRAGKPLMPAYGHVSEADRLALAAYVVSLQGTH